MLSKHRLNQDLFIILVISITVRESGVVFNHIDPVAAYASRRIVISCEEQPVPGLEGAHFTICRKFTVGAVHCGLNPDNVFSSESIRAGVAIF